MCVVTGNELPVEVLVNFVDSEINRQTEHFPALHLVHPGCSWIFFVTRISHEKVLSVTPSFFMTPLFGKK